MCIKKSFLPLFIILTVSSLFSQTWEKDSLIVRQILDTNGLETILVNNVAKKYNGRINALYFYKLPTFHILPVTIGELNTLTDLKICETGIVTIPKEIGNLNFLRIFDLFKNKITSLPPQMGNLDSLKRLDISANELTTIPPEIGNCKNMYIFNFASNKITRIPDEICNIDSLKSIGAQGNLITYVPENIGNMPVIHGINLEWNKLKHVPNSLIHLSLDDVKLCYNDSLVFTPEQQAAWGFKSYQEYYDVACIVETEEDFNGLIKENNARIKVINSKIILQLNYGGYVTCSVYNLFGRKIETLINSVLSEGIHTISWKRDNYSSGVYFIRYSVGNYCYSVKTVIK